MRCWAQHLSLTQGSGLLTRITSDLVRRTKNTFVLYGVYAPYDTRPHEWRIMGLMRKKPYRKKITPIESSEVYVWLVWILTTKHKSLKRVETCQKKNFTFLLFAVLTRSFRINLQTVCTIWIYISFYFFLHWTLDCSFVFEWHHSDLGSERIPRFCLAGCTCTPHSFAYRKCAIVPIGLHWAAIVMIISSCLVSNCYPVSYMRYLSCDYWCNW